MVEATPNGGLGGADAIKDLVAAAAYLGVKPRFMSRLVAEKRIPFHRVGKFLRFRVSDLDDFFESGRVEAEREHPLLAVSRPRVAGRRR